MNYSDLLGSAFCESGIANDEGVELCKQFVQDFVPEAAKALTDDVVDNVAETCSEVFGVC